jgi:hypothetical protein
MDTVGPAKGGTVRKDQVPLLKDQAKAERVDTARRVPDIVVGASASGLQTDTKPIPRSA